jgi:diguanylate cyclase (GGDEF)-like protein
MNRVWNRFVGDHDVKLVMLAALVCAFAAASTMNVSDPLSALAVAAGSFTLVLIGMASARMDRRSVWLAGEADRFRALSDGAFEGVIVHREGRILDANAAARRLLQIPEGEASIDRCFSRCPGSRWAQSGEVDATAIEVELIRGDGTTFPAEISRRRMPLTDGEDGQLITIRDLTSRKESEARIAHLALHDPVTELPNRRLFLELGHKAISVAQRGGEKLAVLVLDIDEFKLVNDVYGHEAGDLVLRTVSERITHALREADVCARFGGDEFTVLQTAISQPTQTLSLVERLLDVLHEPVEWHGAQIEIGVSIGVALYPDDGTTLEPLLRNADTAMYRAKASGKRTSRFFEPQMNAALVARRRLEMRLRQAIANGALTVDYQPLVGAEDRAPVAFEALVRWTDEELGVVSPSEFIPVAEETGLVTAIGDFVLRRACADAKHWPQHLRVAVNLSAAQFRRRELTQSVSAALAESGLPANRLELEITETLLIENREDATRQLDSLRSLGVRVAMDDFGTGYSSLSYLQSFPFDTLKVDRLFVAKLPADPQSLAIVQAVVSMGRSLGMRVVAEGVETEVQAALLTTLLCDDLQGYLVARPMAAHQVQAFLNAVVRSPEIDCGATMGGYVLAGRRPARDADVIPISRRSSAVS